VGERETGIGKVDTSDAFRDVLLVDAGDGGLRRA
jgi:hypothetical protein